MNNLSTNATSVVLSCLNPRELSRCTRVNQGIATLAKNQNLWSRFNREAGWKESDSKEQFSQYRHYSHHANALHDAQIVRRHREDGESMGNDFSYYIVDMAIEVSGTAFSHLPHLLPDAVPSLPLAVVHGLTSAYIFYDDLHPETTITHGMTNFVVTLFIRTVSGPTSLLGAAAAGSGAVLSAIVTKYQVLHQREKRTIERVIVLGTGMLIGGTPALLLRAGFVSVISGVIFGGLIANSSDNLESQDWHVPLAMGCGSISHWTHLFSIIPSLNQSINICEKITKHKSKVNKACKAIMGEVVVRKRNCTAAIIRVYRKVWHAMTFMFSYSGV